MRKLACFLLLCGALAGAQAADIWRWKDANGVVHYSDVQVPGAERIAVQSAPKPGTVVTPATPRNTPAASVPAQQEPEETRIVPYVRCEIGSPQNEETFPNVTEVNVSVDLQPQLQSGHRMQVLLNGKAVGEWPADAQQFPLADLHRGAYTLSARVLDASGAPLCTSQTISFFVQQAIARPRVQHH
jgi:hypothetical protein